MSDAKLATILVVDDEPDLRELTSEILEDSGFGVLQAEDGPQALELLRSHSSITTVFSDVRMPGMDGAQLLKAIKEWSQSINVFMVSGGSGYTEQDLLALGAQGYISKPYSSEVILAAANNSIQTMKVSGPFNGPKQAVWVLEDEQADQDLLAASLEKGGYDHAVSLSFFKSGKNLIDSLLQKGQPPQVMILDINIPGQSGLEVLRYIQEQRLITPETAVIFLTGSKNATDREFALSLGAKAYHVKPSEVVQWRHLARAIVQSWLAPNSEVARAS